MPVPSSPSRRRPVLAGVAAATLAAAAAVFAAATPALAATTTLYASPAGSGTACSASQPCSLTEAQNAVRSRTASMSGDIVVELADGVYRLTAPLRMTAADSGTNGYT
ncbi:right-handed parallel beta-helix repeat-containing protein, partial [Micromonospora sp. DH15]|nr:right-handed parallel beta-helix repeat-containing protein [Micromonospora sp. DH15]